MLSLAQVEDIHREVSQVAALISAFESKEVRFIPDALEWIHTMEEVLQKHRIPQASEIALLRAEVLVKLRSKPANKDNKTHSTLKRSEKEVATADVIQRVGAIVHDAIQKPRALFDEGENIARQIASVAQRKGLINETYGTWAEATQLWERIYQDNDLINATTHLVGLVGRINSIMIFSKSLSEI